jgi:hypothetical protein
MQKPKDRYANTTSSMYGLLIHVGTFKQQYLIRMLNQSFRQYQQYYILKCKKIKKMENKFKKHLSYISLARKNTLKRSLMNSMSKERF